MDIPADTKCKNCEVTLVGPICHACGQPYYPDRWTLRVLLRRFLAHFTDIEKGFLHTIRALLTTPGRVITGFWNGRTIDHYDPFRFALIWVGVTVLISFWFDIDDLIQEAMNETDASDAAERRFNAWFNLMVLVQIPIMSLVTFGMFRRTGNSYAEHLILMSYATGEMAAVGVLTQTVVYFFPGLIHAYLGGSFLIGWAYNAFVFRQVFGQGVWLTIGKAFLVGAIGIGVFLSLTTLLEWIAVATT